MKLINFQLDQAAAQGDSNQMIRIVAREAGVPEPESNATLCSDLSEWSYVEIRRGRTSTVYYRDSGLARFPSYWTLSDCGRVV